MIKILIADDHTVLMDGFISIFENVNNFEVIDTVNNGEEVLKVLAEKEVDIILLDINMPVLNGVETCKKITKEYPTVKVIALSMYRQASFIKRMRQNGAKGYVLKDDTSEVIKEAILEVYNGGEYYSEQLKNIVMNNVFQEKRDDVSMVTKREKEVLELIAQGLTNKAISEKLFLSDHTVVSHRKNLISKFNAKNTAELVKITMEKGLI